MIVKSDIEIFGKSQRVLLCASDFVYILPTMSLRSLVSNYTITFPSKNIISDSYTVLPHGCATLVYSCDGSGLHSSLFGPLTKPCTVGGLANQADMLLIIEFQPAGLYAFTGVGQHELADKVISFAVINSTLDRLVIETMQLANSLDELVDRLDRLLQDSVSAHCPAALQLAASSLLATAGNISCKELSASVYYSERHLNRIFEHYLGMSTKTFSRMIRINKAIRLMHSPHSNITCASDKTGFYDLPHFIHDFKSVCGITPQEYRNNMSDFYSEIAKF